MKTVITCAITGAVTSREQTPYLPVTPEEIATSGLEAAEAGASVLHIHVRNTETTRPSMELELYCDTVDRIKKYNKDVLINLTTGPGALYVPSPENLAIGSSRSVLLGPQYRVKHIEVIKPDICSVDFNTMHQGDGGIRINHKRVVSEMLRLIQQVGTKPELELFDSGDYRIAKEFVDDGTIKGNPLWQFAMGIKYGWDSTSNSLQYAYNLLPKNSLWSAFGIGKNEMPMVAQTMIMGGHVRVGMEDNIYLSKDVLAKTNSELVVKAKRIIEDLGGSVANYSEAREILL